MRFGSRQPEAGSEDGVILLNVLLVVALASTAVLMMATTQDSAIGHSQRFSEAAEAASYARSGEASAVVALRRDAIEAGEIDHYREPWAALSEQEAPIAHGTFTMTIEDAQSRFNVNQVVKGGASAEKTLVDIVAALDLPVAVAGRIAALVRFTGSVTRLERLAEAGLSPDTISRLSLLTTALREDAEVNVNSAGEDLLAILLGNRASARVLAARRERQGYLTPEDVRSARILLPPGLGFTTDHFLVTVDVRVGGTTQRLVSLLERRVDGPDVEVVALMRKR